MHDSVKVELFGITAINEFARHWKPSPRQQSSFVWNVRFADGRRFHNFRVTSHCLRPPKDLTMLEIHAGKAADVTMGTPKDAVGNDTTIDGAYTFALQDPASGTVTPNADGTGFEFRASTTANQMALVDATADVRMGPDVVNHTETLAIAILPGEAATFSASIGPERD